MRSCEKTQVSVKAMEVLVESIEESLQLADVQEVTSKQIGQMVLDRLQPLSEVAYVRFASVYRKFQGARDFVDELDNLSEEGGLPQVGQPQTLESELARRASTIV
jgi:transcriptional repressor NrdR